MSKERHLKIISRGDSSKDYTHEELVDSLKDKYDEFTKHRTCKEIEKKHSKIVNKLVNELKCTNPINEPMEDKYFNYITENYSKLSLDSKVYLYGFMRGLITGEEKL